ncbi:hypothetical protein B0H13DRAFT_2451717 [Mycena leptocephala]|nr:hypothetical protein B0H13DRAFT_2451717 [Mycena leptocephala]
MSYNPESTVPSSLSPLPPPLPMAPGAVNAARASSSPPTARSSSSSALHASTSAPAPACRSQTASRHTTRTRCSRARTVGTRRRLHTPGARTKSTRIRGHRRVGGPRLLTGLIPRLFCHSFSNSATDTDSPDDAASAQLPALLSSQPATLPAAHARYTLKTFRPPPRGFDAFFAFAQERGCLVDGYVGVWRDFARFWRVELALAANSDTHGIAVLTIRDGHAEKPEHQATYFDGDWERTVKFASALPPMTVLINGRDEPRVVFDVGLLFEDPPTLAQALTLSDPTPFTLSPPRTAAFFAQPERKDVCRPARGVDGVGDIPSSSAEFTPDLVPVLSMTKLGDASTSLSGGDNSPEGGSCFADVLVTGEFYYRNSWWAGKCEYPDDVKWEDKKVLYWRGKSNGGHIRSTNYRSFPRFRLMDLAGLPENRAKGLFDVRITQFFRSCGIILILKRTRSLTHTDDCDGDAIRSAYNITGESIPREEAYIKYLLDVDGNTFSGR